jgi:hypothetical protein
VAIPGEAKMTTSLLDTIYPVLERVSADQIEFVNRGDIEEVRALIYDLQYSFKFGTNSESVIVERNDSEGQKKSYFLVNEIERLEHINMPFLELVESNGGNFSLPEQRASDVALRLHLIMEGDIYSVEELVTYIGAGTQRSINYHHTRG